MTKLLNFIKFGSSVTTNSNQVETITSHKKNFRFKV